MWQRPSAAFILLALLIALVPSASAIPPSARVTPPTGNAGDRQNLPNLVAALRSPNFEIRSRATDALMQLPTDRLSDLRQLLARESDPESVTRLTAVALHLYLLANTPMNGPSCLLGVKLTAEPARLGDQQQLTLAVAEVEPGFPAAQALHVGDRIVAAGGKSVAALVDEDTDRLRFADPAAFQSQVVRAFRDLLGAYRPGMQLRMMLLRGGHLIDVPVRLAAVSQEDLANLSAMIDRRSQLAAEFLQSLKTALPQNALIVPDNAPPDR